MEDAASLDPECVRVKFFLVGCVECDMIGVICDGECETGDNPWEPDK